MTEIDYSPAAYERFLATQNRISKWVDNTQAHSHEFKHASLPISSSKSSSHSSSRSRRYSIHGGASVHRPPPLTADALHATFEDTLGPQHSASQVAAEVQAKEMRQMQMQQMQMQVRYQHPQQHQHYVSPVQMQMPMPMPAMQMFSPMGAPMGMTSPMASPLGPMPLSAPPMYNLFSSPPPSPLSSPHLPSTSIHQIPRPHPSGTRMMPSPMHLSPLPPGYGPPGGFQVPTPPGSALMTYPYVYPPQSGPPPPMHPMQQQYVIVGRSGKKPKVYYI